VSNVNGYVTSAHQLYGIDAGRRAFMMSEDDGLTWYSTSTQRGSDVVDVRTTV